MAITYPLTPPSVGGSEVLPAESIQFTYYAAAAKIKSGFTAQTYITRYEGQTLLAQVSLPMLDKVDGRRWQAFLLSLNGPVGTFWLGDPSRKDPLGDVSGCNLLFDDSNQRVGPLVRMRGAVPNRVGVLMPGDHFQIGNRLYIALEQANAGSDGEFTIEVFPALRDLPVDGSPVITTNPRGLFRLVENAISWTTNSAGNTSISFTAEEAI